MDEYMRNNPREGDLESDDFSIPDRGRQRERAFEVPTSHRISAMVEPLNDIEHWKTLLDTEEEECELLQLKDQLVEDIVTPIRYKTCIWASGLVQGNLLVFKFLVYHILDSIPSLCDAGQEVNQSIIQYLLESVVNKKKRNPNTLDMDPPEARKLIFTLLSKRIWKDYTTVTTHFAPVLSPPKKLQDTIDGVCRQPKLWQAYNFFNPARTYEDTPYMQRKFRESLMEICKKENSKTQKRLNYSHTKRFCELVVMVCCAGQVTRAKIEKIRKSIQKDAKVEVEFTKEEIYVNAEELFRVMRHMNISVACILAARGKLFRADQFQTIQTLIEQSKRRRASVFNIIWNVMKEAPECPVFSYIHENHYGELKAFIAGIEALGKDPHLWFRTNESKEKQKIFSRHVKVTFAACRMYMDEIRRDRNIKELQTKIGDQAHSALKRILSDYRAEIESSTANAAYRFGDNENVWNMGGQGGIGEVLARLRATMEED